MITILPKTLTENSYLARYLLLNTFDITDFEIFPSPEIRNAPPAFHFAAPEKDVSILPLLSRSISADAKNPQDETWELEISLSLAVQYLVRFVIGYDLLGVDQR